MTFICCAYTLHLLWEDEVVIVNGVPYCKEHAKDVTFIPRMVELAERQRQEAEQ
jgi:hypothetical protein